MAEKEETRTCGQCHKEVAETNFALHETHCRRFLCLCPDCDEAVPRDQLSQHKEEQHTQVRCSKCHKKMERCHLLDHESDQCVERLQTCEFCELELPWKELGGHIVVCGSRTELCKDCGRYVKLCDQREHALTCTSSDEDSNPPQTSQASADGAAQQFEPRKGSKLQRYNLEKLQQDWLATTRWDDDQEEEEEEEEDRQNTWGEDRETAHALHNTFKALESFRARHNNQDDKGDPDKIRTCPYCHLALPLPTLRWHEAKCRIHIHLK